MVRSHRPHVCIVVDTNVVSHGSGLNEKALLMLQDLAREGNSIVFPAPVLLELARHLADADRKARQTLKPALVNHRILGMRDITVEDCLGASTTNWEALLKSALSKFATIASMPNVPHDQLVRRDLARELPFKESGAGYRDALIWESVRNVAEPGRKVALVSANHRDFGTGAPESAAGRDLPAEPSVTVLNRLAEVRPWLDGHDPQPAAYRSAQSPIPFSTIVSELSDRYFGTATGVRIGTRLHLDADVDYVDDWIELWDATEYANIDENTGAFEAVVVGDAFVSATVPRDLLGLLDEDVSIESESGADEATVSCRRPVQLVATIQYRLDTREIADVQELSVTYHPH